MLREWYWELAQWVLFVHWIGWSFAVTWWRVARMSGRRPRPALCRVIRWGRPVLWPVFGGWAVIGWVQTWTGNNPHMIGLVMLADAVIFWFLRRDWNDTRNMDDDDWMKRLIEKSEGVVRRVGNRLRVAVPAPSTA